MPQIKEITVGGSYTYYPEQYRPIKGEASITFQLVGDEDEREATSIMQGRATEMILEHIVGIMQVHEEIENGSSPKDLIEEDEEKADDLLLGDDDFEF
jgi:hypothetical protein